MSICPPPVHHHAVHHVAHVGPRKPVSLATKAHWRQPRCTVLMLPSHAMGTPLHPLLFAPDVEPEASGGGGGSSAPLLVAVHSAPVAEDAGYSEVPLLEALAEPFAHPHTDSLIPPLVAIPGSAPEPGTWIMLAVGFTYVGGAMRFGRHLKGVGQ